MRQFLLACLFLVATAVPVSAADGDIGVVTRLDGAATIERGRSVIRATLGTPVRQGDTLGTGANGGLGVTFDDDTTLSLGPSSELTLDTFVYDPAEDQGDFLATATQGTFLFVSGRIKHIRPDAMALKTPVATIGIRGTRFAVRVPAKASMGGAR